MRSIFVTSFLYKFYLLVIAAVLGNSILNLLKGTSSLNLNFFDLVGSIFLFMILYFIGDAISKSINIKFRSVSILTYLSSFFVFDLLLMFFEKGLEFRKTFWIVNIIWSCIILYKKFDLKLSFQIVLTWLFSNLFFQNYIDKMSTNLNITGDVKEYFFTHSKNIFENNLYFSMNNPVIDGYPQFSSYLQANMLNFSILHDEYVYLLSTTLVILFLVSLFFYELHYSLLNRALLIILFLSLTFNNLFLQFLFSHSLMSEGIVSLFTAVVFYHISRFQINSERLNITIFNLLAILYFTKQFVSTFALLTAVYFFFTTTKKLYFLLPMLSVVIKELLYYFIFPGKIKSHHLSQINIADTFFDILLFKDLQIINIFTIMENVIKDIPTTSIMLICFISSIQLIILKRLTAHQKFLLLIVISNIVFILLLYISAWQRMELESPVRFINTFLLVKLTILFSNLETLKNN